MKATLIVLFSLADGQSRIAYEEWARTVDAPNVRRLPSVGSFEVLKARGTLDGGASPYEYIEVIQVESMDGLGADITTPAMQEVAAQFQRFAANPVFIVADRLI